MKFLIVGIVAVILILGVLLLWSGWNGFYFPIFWRKTSPDIQRVACIGDSITYGFAIKNWFFHHYPHILQLQLCGGYYVKNFGLSGSTGMKSSGMPYVNFHVYKQSRKFLPNIVVAMFGTNDANSANWRGKEKFISEYKELLFAYQTAESHPVMYVMTPPPLFRKTNADDIAMEQNIEAVRECVFDIAVEMKFCVIDLFNEAKGHPDWFQTDGLHPNAAGAAEIAKIISKQIKLLCDAR